MKVYALIPKTALYIRAHLDKNETKVGLGSLSVLVHFSRTGKERNEHVTKNETTVKTPVSDTLGLV